MLKDFIRSAYQNKGEFPLFIEPASGLNANANALIQYLTENNAEMKAFLHKTGVILFRGFNLASAEDFSNCVKACQLGNFFDYSGGVSPRTKLAEGVFTSTESPPHQPIPPHNEMSYSPNFPGHLFFFCLQASEEGGATPVIDARKVYQSLEPVLREKLERYGVVYKRFLFEKSFRMKILSKLNNFFMSWKETYKISDRALLEAKLKEQGLSFNWLNKQQGLVTTINLPAFRKHPVTGEMVWFNQINSFNDHINSYYSAILGPRFSWLFRYFLLRPENLPCTTTFGNGDKISREQVQNIINNLQRHMVTIPWQKGDFMLIDNYLALHAREPFKGARSILASLTK